MKDEQRKQIFLDFYLNQSKFKYKNKKINVEFLKMI